MLRSQIQDAEKRKDWYGATQYYNRLFYNDSTNIKMAYAYAEASRLNFDLDMAILGQESLRDVHIRHDLDA